MYPRRLIWTKYLEYDYLSISDLDFIRNNFNLLNYSGEYVPEFVSKVLKHLELHGTLKEGIYRVPGAKLEVDRLKARFYLRQGLKSYYRNQVWFWTTYRFLFKNKVLKHSK